MSEFDTSSARCYFCGKLRSISKLKKVRILVMVNVWACDDKHINDCN